SAKLGEALDGEPAAARKLMAGFGESLEGVIGSAVGAAGSIPGRLEAASAETRHLSDTMTALNSRLAQREERLHLQYAALESALLSSKTQPPGLAGHLAQPG